MSRNEMTLAGGYMIPANEYANSLDMEPKLCFSPDAYGLSPGKISLPVQLP